MGKKILSRVMDIVGLNDEYDEIDEMDDREYETRKEREVEDEEEEIQPFKHTKDKVVNINSVQRSSSSSNGAKVVITKPTSYDEATEICDNLRGGRIVVVNINLLDKALGQRMIDFLSGVTYALDAEFQQVDFNIYLLTPSTVRVDNELKNELNSRGLFSFIK